MNSLVCCHVERNVQGAKFYLWNEICAFHDVGVVDFGSRRTRLY